MAKDDVQKVSLVAVPVQPFVQEFPARFDEDGVQVTSGLDSRGHELPDPVPTAPPVGFMATPPLKDLIAQMVRHERFRAEAEAQGYDTFEESEDFDIDDDPLDPTTPYEAEFDPKFIEAKEDYAAKLKGPEFYKRYIDAKNAAGKVKPVEVVLTGGDNGSSAVDERRAADDRAGSGRGGSVGKDQSGSRQKPSDRGSVSKGSGDVGVAEE